MDDITKHLLDRLDKCLEDSRGFARASVGVMLAFISGALAVHAGKDNLLQKCPEKVGFTLALAVVLVVYVANLRYNYKECLAIVI